MTKCKCKCNRPALTYTNRPELTHTNSQGSDTYQTPSPNTHQLETTPTNSPVLTRRQLTNYVRQQENLGLNSWSRRNPFWRREFRLTVWYQIRHLGLTPPHTHCLSEMNQSEINPWTNIHNNKHTYAARHRQHTVFSIWQQTWHKCAHERWCRTSTLCRQGNAYSCHM